MITDQDLVDVVVYEDVMRDDDPPSLGGPETNTTKEVQKGMPNTAPVGAKLNSVRARQVRAREALDAAVKPQEIAQKRTVGTTAEIKCGQRRSRSCQEESSTDDGLSTKMQMLLGYLKPLLSTK